MKQILIPLSISLTIAAGAAMAAPKALDPFPGQGNGFGGFVEGDKPGKGVPGGVIHTKRSPVAVARLLTIFGAISTVGTTEGTK